MDTNHSTMAFSVSIMKGMSKVTGKFRDFEAEIVYDEEDVRNSSIRITIDLSTVDTGIDDRDKHLKSADFLHVTLDIPFMINTENAIVEWFLSIRLNWIGLDAETADENSKSAKPAKILVVISASFSWNAFRANLPRQIATIVLKYISGHSFLETLRGCSLAGCFLVVNQEGDVQGP